MGSGSSKSIKVATLNYGGITHSPFEFFPREVKTLRDGRFEFDDDNNDDNSESLGLLCKYFSHLASNQLMKNGAKIGLKQYKDKQFKWGLGVFDLNMHRQRYSPLYRKDVGIINSRFMKRKQFEKRWWAEYQKNRMYIDWGKKGARQLEEASKKCVVYDYLIFKTFTEYCYEKVYRKMEWKLKQSSPILQDREEDDNSEDRQSKKRRRLVLKRYNDFLDWFFSKPYLSHRKKYKDLLQLLETHDVTFLQDASDQAINDIKNDNRFTIYLSEEGNSAIILRDKRFKTPYFVDKVFEHCKQIDAQTPMKEAQFQYNVAEEVVRKTCCVCLVDDFLFVSILLKNTNYNTQIDAVLTHIRKLATAYPNLNIVIGGDFQNNNLPHRERSYQVSIFPQNDFIPTTIKKRTILQSQMNKNYRLDKQSRDHIVTNMLIKGGKVIVKGGDLKEGEYLPNDKHLFDHAYISATLQSRN